MMPARRNISLALFLLAVHSGMGACRFRQEPPRTFYNTIAGWDIRYIPVIDPIRATSIDGGVTWFLTRPGSVSSTEVSRLGVSQNFVYGRAREGWFLYDTRSTLFAVYDTEAELVNSIRSFGMQVNSMATCNSYFDTLASGAALYWHPRDGKTYPAYPAIQPKNVATIDITGAAGQVPKFSSPAELPRRENGIYFFEVNNNHKDTGLYYLSFNNSAPVPAKDSLVVPVFCNGNAIDITLYTPYPVALEKGIPELDRFLKTRTVTIR